MPGTPSVWGIYVRPQFYWGASPQKYSLVVTGSFDIVACPTYSDDLLCPNACSGYGKCTRSGACVCDAKHFGEDCSLSMAVLYRDAQVNFNAASESWVYYVRKQSPNLKDDEGPTLERMMILLCPHLNSLLPRQNPSPLTRPFFGGKNLAPHSNVCTMLQKKKKSCLPYVCPRRSRSPL